MLISFGFSGRGGFSGWLSNIFGNARGNKKPAKSPLAEKTVFVPLPLAKQSTFDSIQSYRSDKKTQLKNEKGN